MKGIILAGGQGTRLHPVTLGCSKHLLPVYDKPLIYYPLSVLMLAGIQDILIITNPDDLTSYQKLLGNGQNFGCNLEYIVQPEANGIAEAFILGQEFIGQDSVALILGDNLFFGQLFSDMLKGAVKRIEHQNGACVFSYPVIDPERFGVVSLDASGKALSIEEKPSKPKSRLAVTGLYFYDNSVVQKAKSLSPSIRGELEISDINQLYLNASQLFVEQLGRGFAWLDAGTHDSLIEAGSFVQTVEKRQGFKVACLEEIAYYNKWLTKEQMKARGMELQKTSYGQYILQVIEELN